MFKRIGLTLLILVLPLLVFSQNLLSLPESVVWDSLYNRYLVSNWGDGNVIAIDSAGNQSYFLINQQCYAGLTIKDTILYVACREFGVKGFDLETGINVLNVPIPGATNINDVVADSAGFLYVSYPTQSKIYKVNIREASYNLFVDAGLTTPNGMIYDHELNRLVLISYRSYSPVQQVTLEDSVLSYIVPNTGLHELDGLAEDKYGNYYVSSWYSNSVYRYDHDFSNPPEVYSLHSGDPADISIRKEDDILCVPLFFTHELDLVPLVYNEVEESISLTPVEHTTLSSYPNPFNQSSVISFELRDASFVSLDIFDVTGRSIEIQNFKPIRKWIAAGSHSIVFNAEGLTSGVYFARLTAEDQSNFQKLVLVK